ncbi:MAG: FHA domain-containing protein [Akkermansia sp.]|nr:FHA domain-containing protein [Akkermansia sp.]
MEHAPHDNRATLAEQERHIAFLERELAERRAAATLLRAELVCEEAGAPLPEFPKSESAAFLYLAPLKPGGHLCRKWKLNGGLSCGTGNSIHEYDLVSAQERCLHLFGLLSDGAPWQVSIPFGKMAKEGGCIIGRSDDEADIVLDEPGISRRHARLELTDDGLVVTDENSTNGVWVNEKKLNAYERQVPLEDGGTLALGNILLRAEYN